MNFLYSLAQLFVIVVGVMAGVRGSLSVRGQELGSGLDFVIWLVRPAAKTEPT